jgi:hypothetical protein
MNDELGVAIPVFWGNAVGHILDVMAFPGLQPLNRRE